MRNSFSLRILIPVFALAGLGLAVYYIEVFSRPPQFNPVQVSLPPTSPFEESISGSGVIEANSRNVDVGSHLSGVASDVFVTEGQLVEKGDPLFKLDDRSAKASLHEHQASVFAADAQIKESEAVLADMQAQLYRAEQLRSGISITADRLERAHFAVKTAEAKASLAKANLSEAKSRLASAQVLMDKLTVRAPLAGRILKVNVRVGEYVQAGSKSPPPIVLGNDKPLFVRVSVDENDLWRLDPTSGAEGALRSNRAMRFPLTFVRVEPFVVPKTSLTGQTSERVDTRVLEVLYRIDDEKTPLYIGQQIDVFISAPKLKADREKGSEGLPDHSLLQKE